MHRAASPLTTWLQSELGASRRDAAGLQAVSYIDLNADLPDTRNVVAAPDEPTVAWHADTGLGTLDRRLRIWRTSPCSVRRGWPFTDRNCCHEF